MNCISTRSPISRRNLAAFAAFRAIVVTAFDPPAFPRPWRTSTSSTTVSACASSVRGRRGAGLFGVDDRLIDVQVPACGASFWLSRRGAASSVTPRAPRLLHTGRFAFRRRRWRGLVSRGLLVADGIARLDGRFRLGSARRSSLLRSAPQPVLPRPGSSTAGSSANGFFHPHQSWAGSSGGPGVAFGLLHHFGRPFPPTSSTGASMTSLNYHPPSPLPLHPARRRRPRMPDQPLAHVSGAGACSAAGSIRPARDSGAGLGCRPQVPGRVGRSRCGLGRGSPGWAQARQRNPEVRGPLGDERLRSSACRDDPLRTSAGTQLDRACRARLGSRLAAALTVPGNALAFDAAMIIPHGGTGEESSILLFMKLLLLWRKSQPPRNKIYSLWFLWPALWSAMRAFRAQMGLASPRRALPP